MCIKNQDVDKMLKGIRRIERKEAVDMTVEELAEVMAVFKSLADDYEKVEKELRAELAERIGGEVVMFPGLERKVQLKDGRATKKIDGESLFSDMKERGLEDYFSMIANVVLKKVDELHLRETSSDFIKREQDAVADLVEANTTIEIGQPYVAVSKMAKADY